MTTLLAAALAFPTAASAQEEELIPPDNSAVTQYTESLPTPGGKTNTESHGKVSRPSPHKALGNKNTQRLAQHGADGRAAAETAAETAPTTSITVVSDREEEAAAPAANGNSGGGGKAAAGGSGGNDGGKQAPVQETVKASVEVEEPAGSSGFGEVLGEATGTSSDGQMGWLLPLAIVAIALWAALYATRQRRRVS
jgi:hypothetical protein